MKKVVWGNKSNGQLCVTIPKGSGIKEGDVVGISKEKIKKIIYTYVVADLFHYGHLQFLEKANVFGDFHVCGVLTNNAVLEYKDKPIADFEERKAIISNLRCVDMVLAQKTLNPSENLKKLKEQFKDSKIVLIHADNWEKIPGQEFVKTLGGSVVKFPYYTKLADEKINKEMKKR